MNHDNTDRNPGEAKLASEILDQCRTAGEFLKYITEVSPVNIGGTIVDSARNYLPPKKEE
jgi:hypothetical protein